MGCASRFSGLLAALALALAVAFPVHADAAAWDSARTEQDERLEAAWALIEQWGDIGAATPLVLQDMGLLVEASLAWLDDLDPDACWRPWWAQARATWELMRLAIGAETDGNAGGTLMALNGWGASRHITGLIAEVTDCA